MKYFFFTSLLITSFNLAAEVENSGLRYLQCIMMTNYMSDKIEHSSGDMKAVYIAAKPKFNRDCIEGKNFYEFTDFTSFCGDESIVNNISSESCLSRAETFKLKLLMVPDSLEVAFDQGKKSRDPASVCRSEIPLVEVNGSELQKPEVGSESGSQSPDPTADGL